MRRDRIDVSIRDPDAAHPVLAIDFDGPSEQLANRLPGPDSDSFAAGALDVTVRRTSGERGVLALTDRVTGAIVLEASVDVSDLLVALGSVRDAEDPADRQYSVRVTDADGTPLRIDKRTLLVYDEDGSLSRAESLIPGGVEL